MKTNRTDILRRRVRGDASVCARGDVGRRAHGDASVCARGGAARWAHGDAAVWCLCFAVSFGAAVLASADSPFTHTAAGHIDTAWFLDAGRWLMQGLTPYEDFADSKGPLLWLFFGLGYLLDHDGWSGMFVLYALYSVFVYRCVWLAAMEMLGLRTGAVFVVLFMPLALLGFGHQENRAEDLCQLPLAYFIYLVARAFRGKAITRRQYVLAGVAMGCMLFVKWNFPAMLLPLPVIMLCHDARHRSGGGGVEAFKYAMSRLGLALAGFAAVALCVIAFMAALGGLQGMFREYFFNTLRTVHWGGESMFAVWFDNLTGFLGAKKYIIAVILSVPAGAFMAFGRKGFRVFAAFLWMLFLCFFNFFPYYVRAADAFGLFVPVAFWLLAKRFFRPGMWLIALEIPAVCAYLYLTTRINHSGFGYDPQTASFFRMCERVERAGQPRILYLDLSDYSLGIASNALPACRYWAMQNGGGAAMCSEQIGAMARREADIIVTESRDFRPEQHGYRTGSDDLFCCPIPNGKNYRVHWRTSAL